MHMSKKISQLEPIALDALATITGGFFGSGGGTDAWNQALRSGKTSGPGSTLDVLQRNHATPSWRWR
jgi:hypothetical protein